MFGRLIGHLNFLPNVKSDGNPVVEVPLKSDCGAYAGLPSTACSPLQILSDVGGVSLEEAGQMIRNAESAFGGVEVASPIRNERGDDPAATGL